MDQEQSKRLGKLLRTTRNKLGLSTYQVAEFAGMDQANVSRLESGKVAFPKPGNLSRITQLLGLSGADVFTMAGYTVPRDLPSFRPYLRSKYRDLPQEDLDKIETYARKLAQEHGVDIGGPEPGEDEEAENNVTSALERRKIEKDINQGRIT